VAETGVETEARVADGVAGETEIGGMGDGEAGGGEVTVEDEARGFFSFFGRAGAVRGEGAAGAGAV
jgi:hypothetical protein